MARGGARNNAGRPQGVTNKLTQEAVEKAKETGVLPHEYLLSIVQNEHEEQALRVHCAIAVAPYYAPKLTTTKQEITGQDGGPIAIANAYDLPPQESFEEWQKRRQKES